MVASTSSLPDDGVADAATNEESVDGPSRPRGVRRMVHLPGHHRSAHAARVLLREVLTAAGSPQWLPGAEIACTELVTNVVLHAHTDLELTVEVTDVLRVAVRDYNSTLPLQRHYPLDATTGRGLGLVAAVSNAHGIADAGPDGKTLWFVIGKPAGDRPRDERDTDWDGASWDLDGLRVPLSRPGSQAVRLLGLPPALWLVARQHHDAMLRELAFYQARHQISVDLTAADRARFLISNAAVTAIESTRRTHRPVVTPPGREDQPLPADLAPFDLDLELPPGAGGDVTAMQHALDVAEELARAGMLLTPPGRPEVVAVRTWACDQITAQLAGAAASPWAASPP